MSELTQEQIQAGKKMLIDLREKLLSMNIKLKDNYDNGHAIATEVRKRGLPYSVDSALQVVNAILFQDKLEFVPGFEPAKLKARKLNQANVQVNPDQRADAIARDELRVAVEKAEKQRAEEEKCFQRINDAISGLSLHFKSTTADQQARLRAYVKQQKNGNKIPETIFTAVKNEIERLYAEEQRRRERV